MALNRCRWVRRRLALLAGDLDGRDLAWDDRRRVERHLLACPSCRVERLSLESAVAVLHRASAVAPVATLADAPSLWPVLARQIRRSRHRSRPSLAMIGVAPALGLAAGVLVVGGIIGLIGWSLGSASALASRPAPPRLVARPPTPRHALPDGPPLSPSPRDLFASDPAHTPRPEMRASLDLDPTRTTPASNPRDPQRSQ